jgi:uncharacterized protein
MIEMELSKIIIDEKHQDQVVVLKEKNGTQILPIVIGLMEAASIKMRLAGIKPPRPLTHDLLYSTIESLGCTVEKVVIDKLEDSVFYAKLVIKTDSGASRVIDARPSDCLAISVRSKSPIFVEEEVLKNTPKV